MTTRAVIVVCDSLAAKLIDARTAPHLAMLRGQSAEFVHARSVFPSITRTSSASMATGCTPALHGLLGNTMVLDEGEGLRCMSVGKPDFLDRLRRVTGRTLHRPTLAQRLAGHGGSVVMSNVSPGAAYLQDPEGFGHVYHRSGSYGPGRVPLADGMDVATGIAGDAAMTERFCREALRERAPRLAVLWLSEPDHTAHRVPLGSPAHREAIAAADRCVQQVRETIASLDPGGQRILLVACSDHGMQTVHRQIDLVACLVAAGFKQGPESSDVVVAPNGTAALLYFSEAARDRIAAVAHWLRAQDFCGQVLTGAALAEVGLPMDGPLGLALTMRWDDSANPFGVSGRSDTVLSPFSSESRPGCAQHGGLGAQEQAPFLYLHGGGFAPGVRRAAASLIDIAPTVLSHLGVFATGMQGRVLR